MKLLLVQPPDIFISPRCPPLGLCYLGAIAESKGWQVKVAVSTSGNPYVSHAQIVREAIRFAPNIIGITILTLSAKISYALIRDLSCLKVPIIVGGPHASVLPEEVLIHSLATVVVRGEGEETFGELLDFFAYREKSLKQIQGISYRDEQEKIIHNSDRLFLPEEKLNTLPFPAKHLFLKKHFNLQKFGNIATSRGCPFSCTFCSQGVFKRTHRLRSVENVFQEIEELHKRYGIRHLFFVDDVFTLNGEWVKSLCERIIASRLPLTWHCFSRIDCVNEELLKKMKEAGCIFIIYGIESVNSRSLCEIKKKTSLEDIKRTLFISHKAGIGVFLSLIWGFPWETDEDIERLITFIHEISPVTYFIGLNIIVPFPATELYNQYNTEYNFREWWLNDKKLQRELHLYQQLRYYYPNAEYSFFALSSRIIKKMEEGHSLVDKRNILTQAMIRKKNGKYVVLKQEAVINTLSFKLKRLLKLFLINSSKLLSSFAPGIELRFLVPGYKVAQTIWRKF